MLPPDSAANELFPRKLSEPPPPGFDCGREEQNRFLYDSAWRDQQERLSVTYLYYATDVFAAFATVCMTSIVLGSREKPRSIPYKAVGGLLLAQLGVDRRYQGWGMGSGLVADWNQFARELSRYIGCRYMVLDAQPELVPWYEKQGFVINRAMQRRRIEQWAGERDPATLSVSMRFDLLPPAERRAA